MDALNSLTKILEEYLVTKAPALPANVKEVLVKLAPWIAIIIIVISLPAILALIGLNSFLYSSPFGAYMMGRSGLTYTLGILFLVVDLVMRGLSVPGLMSRTKSGWNWMYYSILVGAIYSLLTYDFVGLVVGTLVSLYLLFQVKEYYK